MNPFTIHSNRIEFDEDLIPVGLSSFPKVVRMESNLFKVDAIYTYREKLPHYMKDVPTDVKFGQLRFLGENAVTWHYTFVYKGDVISVIYQVDTFPDRNASLQFRSDAQAQVRRWKAEIRDLYGIGPHNYHTFRSPQKG